MILAQQLEGNDVKYITVTICLRDRFTSLLTTFYPNEQRVSALIKLGNLFQLAPSPYGKNVGGTDDPVHCLANIRDSQMSRGSNIAKIKDISKLKEKEGHIFLFRDGKWHYFNKNKKCYSGDDFTTELPMTIPTEREDTLYGLEFKTIDSNNISSIYGRSFETWSELERKSEESGQPIFVFRGNKLVYTINHPLKRQAQ